MRTNEPHAEISLAGHPRASIVNRRILHAACMAFFQKRGIPEQDWKGRIAADVKEQTAKRTEQLKRAQERFYARKKKAKGAK